MYIVYIIFIYSAMEVRKTQMENSVNIKRLYVRKGVKLNYCEGTFYTVYNVGLAEAEWTQANKF